VATASATLATPMVRYEVTPSARRVMTATSDVDNM
jgi:hypothetical protein